LGGGPQDNGTGKDISYAPTDPGKVTVTFPATGSPVYYYQRHGGDFDGDFSEDVLDENYVNSAIDAIRAARPQHRLCPHGPCENHCQQLKNFVRGLCHTWQCGFSRIIPRSIRVNPRRPMAQSADLSFLFA
jgi:hypothetical protein